MPEITSYKSTTPYLTDFLIGTDRENDNVTRNFKVSEVVNTILAALNIGTVYSIATSSSTFVSVTGGTITTTGTITADLSATGTKSSNTFLRGDNTWAEPGPTPTDIQLSYNGVPLTTDVESMDFTGLGVTAGGSNNNIVLIIPGDGSAVDSVIAGAGISLNASIGGVIITNAGTTQARAGGNVTLSGGTGAVTVSTTANSGTVVAVNPGLGIDTIANNTSNPEIDVDYTGTNNYISSGESIATTSKNDLFAFAQLTSSNVKTSRFRDIPANILTLVEEYIDNNDDATIKNVEPAGFDETGQAQKMITLTIAEYNAIPTKDPNTLYFIIGAGTSFTQTLARDVSGITGTGTYTLSPALPQTVTGPTGTSFSFTTSITGDGGSTVTGSNMPLTTSGTIGSSDATTTQVLTATVTAAPNPQCSAELAVSLLGNLNTGYTTAWQYKSGTDQPGATTSSNNCPISYNFNTEVELVSTSTYQWATSPTYENNVGGSLTATPGFSGTVSSGNPSTVTHEINATWEEVPYTALLTVNDNTTVIGSPPSSPSYNWNISSDTPSAAFNGTFAGLSTGTTGAQITGLNNISGNAYNSYKWSNPSTPNLPANFAWKTGPTYTWTSSGTGTPSVQTISGANGSDTLTIAGEIEYTAPSTPQEITTNYTDSITYTNGSSSDVTFSPLDGATSGLVSPLQTYTIPGGSGVPLKPTATAAAPYNLDSFNASNTNAYGLTGTMPLTGTTSDWTFTGTLDYATATIVTNLTSTSMTCTDYTLLADGGDSVTFTGTNCTTGNSQSILIPLGDSGSMCSRTLPTMSPNTGSISTGSSCGSVRVSYTCNWSSNAPYSLTQSVIGTSNSQTNSGFRIGDGSITLTVNRTGPNFGEGSNVVPTGRTLVITWPDATQTTISGPGSASNIQKTVSGITHGSTPTVQITET